MTPQARLILIVLLLTSCVFIFAQERRVIVRHGPGASAHGPTNDNDVLHLPELSALISTADGNLTVDHIVEPAMRAKGFEKTELKEGDRILMANGKKLNGLSDLRTLYADAPIGAVIKLGIKRNEELAIVSFTKADPKTMPHMRMMISKGDDDDFFGIPQVGLRFAGKNGGVVIKEVLPNASTELPNVEVKEGDAVSTLNGTAIKSMGDFATAYGKLRSGDRVELGIEHGTVSRTVVFMKPKDDGRVIIRRQEKQ